MKPIVIGAACGAVAYILVSLLRAWAWRNGRIAKGRHYQTSFGAEVPVADARRVLKLYDLVMADKATPWERGDWATQDSASKLGHFQLDAINIDGSITVGCHTISAAEIERLRALLEVQS